MDKKKILIADDEEPMATILKNFLNMKGYDNIDVFFDGAKAMEAVKADGYDIAFLDAHMPNVSGIEIARYIKENHLKTKTVMITGSVLKDSPDGTAAYADEYLVKPFHLQEVEDIVEKYRK